jgi:hypothetical protein
VQTPKVYQLSELGNRVSSVDSEERNNDSGRGRSHVVYMPGSMVGTDQYIMRNPNIRIRTVLVRCVGCLLLVLTVSFFVFSKDPLICH